MGIYSWVVCLLYGKQLVGLETYVVDTPPSSRILGVASLVWEVQQQISVL